MPSLRRVLNLISTVGTISAGEGIDAIESMKGPEAKVLYNHVMDELGKGLPGGKEKVKGGYHWRKYSLTGSRWSFWGHDASRYLE